MLIHARQLSKATPLLGAAQEQDNAIQSQTSNMLNMDLQSYGMTDMLVEQGHVPVCPHLKRYTQPVLSNLGLASCGVCTAPCNEQNRN